MDNTIRTSMKVTLGHLRDVRRGLPCTAHIETLLQGTTASTERPSTLLLTLLYTRAALLKRALCRTTFWSAVHFYTGCETRFDKSDEQKQLLAYHVSNEPHQPIVYPLEWLLAIRFICSSGTDVARLIFTSWWPDVGRA